MTLTQICSSTLVLLIGTIVSGYFAIFSAGGNVYLLFWLLCTSLFFIGGLLSAKFFNIAKVTSILLVSFLTFVGFVLSSPVGLMSFYALMIIVGFSAYVLILLIAGITKTILN